MTDNETAPMTREGEVSPSPFDRIKVRFAPPGVRGYEDWHRDDDWLCEVYVDGSVRLFDAGPTGMAAASRVIAHLMYSDVVEEDRRLREAKAVVEAHEGENPWGNP